jgi:hypothetical protein
MSLKKASGDQMMPKTNTDHATLLSSSLYHNILGNKRNESINSINKRVVIQKIPFRGCKLLQVTSCSARCVRTRTRCLVLRSYI